MGIQKGCQWRITLSDTQNTQLSLPEKAADEAKATAIKNSWNGNTTRIVYRKGGLFARKPQPPSPKQVRQALASKLTTPLDQNGRTHLEEAFDAQLAIAKRTDVENIGTSATKAYEAVLKSAGLLEKAENTPQPLTIIFQRMELLNPEVVDGDAPRPVLKPSFIDAEVVSTNEPTRY
jgi:hypothetical protein